MDYDFIGIGDITADAFIRLKEASVHCDVNHEHCRICLDFAAKVPYESVTVIPAVGNSPNAAVAAARLGLKSALVTNLGNDDHGAEALTALRVNNVDTSFVKTHPGLKTNYHYVLWYEDERTILVKHEKFPYAMPDIGTPQWIYLSSMGQSSLPFHQAIAEYLTARPSIKLAFQPGTFQMKAGIKALNEFYRRAEIFFSNAGEARLILKKDGGEIKDLLRGIRDLGPKTVIITDGPRGAYAYQDEKFWFVPIYPDANPPYERTGAGDAFSSTVTAALVLGKNLEEALLWGPINSMSVVQGIGAQEKLLRREELEKYLAKASADYRLRQI